MACVGYIVRPCLNKEREKRERKEERKGGAIRDTD
jgi:hypothetical protein